LSCPCAAAAMWQTIVHTPSEPPNHPTTRRTFSGDKVLQKVLKMYVEMYLKRGQDFSTGNLFHTRTHNAINCDK